MNEIYEKSLLLDFYGELLTEKQREICRLSWTEDWSLGEIAQAQGISRQGVSDALKKSSRTLTETEEKLHMAGRFLALQQGLTELEGAVKGKAPDTAVLGKIQELKQKLLETESYNEE